MSKRGKEKQTFIVRRIPVLILGIPGSVLKGNRGHFLEHARYSVKGAASPGECIRK